jgi:ADP-ribose pyrophosphatase YjhB (NUDIX family)
VAAEIRYCPYCGTPVERKMLFGMDRPVCPVCGWVHYADPKVAAAVVVINQGKILLTRRVNEPYQGLWTLPAGFVNAHEDPRDAARRECLEETGLTVALGDLLDVWSVSEHARGADILIVYTATVLEGTLAAGDDADQAAFFDPQDLPPLAFKSTARIMEKLSSNGAFTGV